MKRGAGALIPLLFGSGACALVYQTVWLREFRLVFGASTAANAAVLAVFIGGLGVGGFWLGARADRHERPLSLYANLEVLIALSSAATPGLLWVARGAYVALGGTATLGSVGGALARLFLTTLVLAGPTVLMGGTLPALARGVETSDDRGRRTVGLLYGVNTLGAVAGCLLGTFVLLEVFGARLALWLACLVNLLIGISARALARTLPVPTEATPNLSSPDASPERTDEALAPSWLILSAAGSAGFAFFLMELVWYRMLGPLLGGTVFSFGLILALALLGIGLGAAFHATLGRSRAATLGGFSLTCLLEAACLALPYALGDRVAVLSLYLRPFGVLGFGAFVASWTIVTALVVLPTAFVAGVQFPLLIGLLGRGRAAVGRQVGLVYAANTAGSIVGALAGGFGLIPLLSAPGCWRAVAWLLALLGLTAAAVAARRRLEPAWLATQLLLALLVVGLVESTGPTAVWRHSPIGVGRVSPQATASVTALHAWMRSEQRAVLWEADGVESSVAMNRSSGLAFVLNGKIDGHVRVDAATQVMSGLVGAALHPSPKSALVIGLGTGSTAGWLAAIPSVERVDVAELEPRILDVVEQCRAVNHAALQNPKLHVILGDAREVLLTSRTRYDVIASEPSNPYRAGISSLFTREFYEAVRDHLAPGGLFVQWAQAYNVDARTLSTIYATLDSVFPAVDTWELGTSDLLLVASHERRELELPRLRQRLSEEPFRSALAESWRTTRLEGFLGHFVADAAFARALGARPGELLGTDDLNPIEFGFARAASNAGGFSSAELRKAARARNQFRPRVSGAEVDWAAVDGEWNAFETSEQTSPEPRPDASLAERAIVRSEGAFLAGDFAEAARAFRLQPREPTGPTELALLGLSLAASGDEGALPYIERLRALEPVEADMLLGRLRAEQRRFEDAASALERAFVGYRSDPWPWLLLAQSALDTAQTLATQAPAQAPELYAVLATPFAARLLDESRLTARTAIAMRLRTPGTCVKALAELEPIVPWRLDLLAWRSQCYEQARYPDAPRAAAELEEYLAEQPPSLLDRL